MKAIKVCVIVMCLGLAAISCNQHPIFYNISHETAPVPPLIEGSPTNMVVFNRSGKPVLYVASGNLHCYAEDTDNVAKWNLEDYSIPTPDGKIIYLAVAGTRLYALCLTGYGVEAVLKYYEDGGTEWKNITSEASGYPYIQSMYADNGQLFVGACKGDMLTYAILRLEGDTLKMLAEKTSSKYYGSEPEGFKQKEEISMLSSVVYRDGFYYLSTKGSGILKVKEDLTSLPEPLLIIKDETITTDKDWEAKSRRMFMGMIKLKDTAETIIAVEREGGVLYKVDPDYKTERSLASFEPMLYDIKDREEEAIATGRYATGALALWEGSALWGAGKKMLIAGMQGGLYSTVSTTSHTHGYVEFDLNTNGSFNRASPRRDAGELDSVLSRDQYASSLGKHPINHLFQATDIDMTFFASTQTEGLWSYRDRPGNGGLQWNAEQ